MLGPPDAVPSRSTVSRHVSPTLATPSRVTTIRVQSRPPRPVWTGVPMNSALPPAATWKATLNAVAFATDRMSAETDATSSVSTLSRWFTVRNVAMNAKSFMRGSKPGRSPVRALTCMALASVRKARPSAAVPVPVTSPCGSGRFFSPGSSSGLPRNRSSPTRMPPSMTSGPRIPFTRPSSAGNTRASLPSTKSSSSARTSDNPAVTIVENCLLKTERFFCFTR